MKMYASCSTERGRRMDISSIAAKAKVASVVLLSGVVVAAVQSPVASATTRDDYDGNTKICRQTYPSWNNSEYLDVWFGRDGYNNPTCYARLRGIDQPRTLQWPQGVAVIVICDNRCGN